MAPLESRNVKLTWDADRVLSNPETSRRIVPGPVVRRIVSIETAAGAIGNDAWAVSAPSVTVNRTVPAVLPVWKVSDGAVPPPTTNCAVFWPAAMLNATCVPGGVSVVAPDCVCSRMPIPKSPAAPPGGAWKSHSSVPVSADPGATSKATETVACSPLCNVPGVTAIWNGRTLAKTRYESWLMDRDPLYAPTPAGVSVTVNGSDAPESSVSGRVPLKTTAKPCP